MLSIKNVDVLIDNKKVLSDFSLDIDDGSIHVIMGPNGGGKSTLSKVIMGDNNYKIVSGDILFNGQSIKNMTTDTVLNKTVDSITKNVKRTIVLNKDTKFDSFGQIIDA